MRTGLTELKAHAREHPECGHPPERMRAWEVHGTRVRACVDCLQLLEGTWWLRPGRAHNTAAYGDRA